MTAPARSSSTPSASMSMRDGEYSVENDIDIDNNVKNNIDIDSITYQQRLTRTVSLSINTDRESDKDRDRNIGRDRGSDNSREALNNNNNSNNNNNNMIELSIRPLSTYAAQAMNEVKERFYSDSCEVQSLLESALGADPSNFKKVKRVL